MFAVVTVVLAGVAIWTFLEHRRQSAEDRQYHEQHLVPMWAAQKERALAFEQALKERKEGKRTPLPDLQPINPEVFEAGLERMKRRHRILALQNQVMAGLAITVFAWFFYFQYRAYMTRRHLESAERPAGPGAGQIVGPLIAQGSIFSARDSDHSSATEVAIDGKRLVVVFRNYTFVSKFVGNRNRSLAELDFGELLAGSITRHKGRSYFSLRTTQGKIVVSDDVQPFDKLTETLLDIIELNRTQPDTYRAARAREPIVQTPWYGWLILAAAVATAVVIGWRVLAS
ncbi:MAG: hypothetical protein JNK23_24155 [Opitutaceae bacterium]|nr:hypothetical protein [Opitutaceae bacterium]